jgi:hypothetical protein
MFVDFRQWEHMLGSLGYTRVAMGKAEVNNKPGRLVISRDQQMTSVNTNINTRFKENC